MMACICLYVYECVLLESRVYGLCLVSSLCLFLPIQCLCDIGHGQSCSADRKFCIYLHSFMECDLQFYESRYRVFWASNCPIHAIRGLELEKLARFLQSHLLVSSPWLKPFVWPFLSPHNGWRHSKMFS